MKAEGIPGVLHSVEFVAGFQTKKINFFLVEFKDKVRINDAVDEIKTNLNLDGSRVSLNNHLLAVIGQSEHQAATGLYTISAVLFTIVLIAGVVMIYNTFNISVMERVREYGLLRCVGAAKSHHEYDEYQYCRQSILPGRNAGHRYDRETAERHDHRRSRNLHAGRHCCRLHCGGFPAKVPD